ncbi:MAG: YggT family protein [Actinomycetota bacterium]|nr:YggT family protein [Actinomycetota bacterium]
MTLICSLLGIYLWVIIIRIVLEWIQVPTDHPVGRVRDALAAVTDPVLRPVRRLVPPISFGSAGLDLSPLVVIIGLQILRSAIC